MAEIEFGNTKDLDRDSLPKTKSPYERMVERIKDEGEFYTYPEVAAMTSTTVHTIRKVTSDEDLDAPSKYVKWGGRYVWLFTKNDVKAVAKILKVDVKWESS